MPQIKLHLVVCLSFLIVGCTTMQGDTSQEKQASVLKMRDSVLTELFKQKPQTRAMIQAAPGYAVFDNGNINLLVVSFGGGYGVVKDNKSGHNTYMKMAEAGVGFGAGVKDFRVVIIFHKPEVMQRFIEHGWQVGAHADASAKVGSKGGAVAAEAMLDNMTIYQITESGLSLQAQLKGAKFWVDNELN